MNCQAFTFTSVETLEALFPQSGKSQGNSNFLLYNKSVKSLFSDFSRFYWLLFWTWQCSLSKLISIALCGMFNKNMNITTTVKTDQNADNEEKYIEGCKCNIKYASFNHNHGQWKLFYGQWKVRECFFSPDEWEPWKEHKQQLGPERFCYPSNSPINKVKLSVDWWKLAFHLILLPWVSLPNVAGCVGK